jgi:hypothetical protein
MPLIEVTPCPRAFPEKLWALSQHINRARRRTASEPLAEGPGRCRCSDCAPRRLPFWCPGWGATGARGYSVTPAVMAVEVISDEPVARGIEVGAANDSGRGL